MQDLVFMRIQGRDFMDILDNVTILTTDVFSQLYKMQDQGKQDHIVEEGLETISKIEAICVLLRQRLTQMASAMSIISHAEDQANKALQGVHFAYLSMMRGDYSKGLEYISLVYEVANKFEKEIASIEDSEKTTSPEGSLLS
jgi:hypothetical protein